MFLVRVVFFVTEEVIQFRRMSYISLLILLLTLGHIFCVDCVGSHRKPEGFEEGHAISPGGKEAPELQRDAQRSIET